MYSILFTYLCANTYPNNNNNNKNNNNSNNNSNNNIISLQTSKGKTTVAAKRYQVHIEEITKN
jgi:hypothetical protein